MCARGWRLREFEQKLFEHKEVWATQSRATTHQLGAHLALYLSTIITQKKNRFPTDHKELPPTSRNVLPVDTQYAQYQSPCNVPDRLTVRSRGPRRPSQDHLVTNSCILHAIQVQKLPSLSSGKIRSKGPKHFFRYKSEETAILHWIGPHIHALNAPESQEEAEAEEEQRQ